jgi:hypothetical protein
MHMNFIRTMMLSGQSGLCPALLGPSCWRVDSSVGFGFQLSVMLQWYTTLLSPRRLTSPHLLMYGEKPDTTNHQQFGEEGFIVEKVSGRT